ncbi:MAG: 16S rRNA (cytosine(1402)-N(4))-methyltransferase RsmH [Elusimicrobia bacterium]|nr:16S rRNA (cytosine(1402)-N(4))-methyltransferase RsmH [Elusimicrobiota bacterium]MBU2614516.1 16S rRNA (cytosine(1402)-N(4))-methyltransferase RsmH [Elusimicrobiota bacterium]
MAEHVPVLLNEAVEYLNVKPGGIYVDATLGLGGYAKEILKKIGPGGLLIGVDNDKETIVLAEKEIQKTAERYQVVNDNFGNLEEILKNTGFPKIDGIVFDLGVSSYQLSKPERGFSFNSKGPLDMRMNTIGHLTAFEVVNGYPQEKLTEIFKDYGEERWAKKIAENIAQARQGKSIEDTLELSEIIKSTIPRRFWEKHLHPATRVFQAIRIEVNSELENLEKALNASLEYLKNGGRIVVVSFHSLEDRIVKRFFQENSDKFEILTKKPVLPASGEIAINPRARSAKLRAAILRLS